MCIIKFNVQVKALIPYCNLQFCWLHFYSIAVSILFYLCQSPCIVKEGQIEYTSVSVLLFCFLCQASQKELQAMETMTAAFIHKFPRVTPELFVDLSQFIPFMSVADIMSFPASLIVNDSV